jgi:hypothetical protein
MTIADHGAQVDEALGLVLRMRAPTGDARKNMTAVARRRHEERLVRNDGWVLRRVRLKGEASLPSTRPIRTRQSTRV